MHLVQQKCSAYHINHTTKRSSKNNRLVIKCGERHIPVIGHSKTIRPDTHLDKSPFR